MNENKHQLHYFLLSVWRLTYLNAYKLLIVTVPGHFAERHFAERHFAERHFAERHFAERHFAERHFAENREILGVVTRTAYDWLLNKISQSYNQLINLMTETLIVK